MVVVEVWMEIWQNSVSVAVVVPILWGFAVGSAAHPRKMVLQTWVWEAVPPNLHLFPLPRVSVFA